MEGRLHDGQPNRGKKLPQKFSRYFREPLPPTAGASAAIGETASGLFSSRRKQNKRAVALAFLKKTGQNLSKLSRIQPLDDPADVILTAAALRDKSEAKARRQEIGLFKNGPRTLRLFCSAVWQQLVAAISFATRHLGTLAIISIIAAGILTLINRLGPTSAIDDTSSYHARIYRSLIFYIKCCSWWVGLGMLSSIGLGSGVHTGLLFVFPHNYMIAQTSEECNNLHFDPSVNMWGLHLEKSASGSATFTCEQTFPNSQFDSNVKFLPLLLKALPYSILWGIGTAIGELPPYIAGLAAAKARSEEDGTGTLTTQATIDSLITDTTSSDAGRDQFENSHETIKKRKFGLKLRTMWNNAKRRVVYYMLKLVDEYRGLAVFLLSCWPNAFFDLCGLLCGQSGMPFWEFFIPLLFGKGLVKVVIQTSGTFFLLSKTCDRLRARMIAKIAQLPPFELIIRWRFGEAEQFEDWIMNKVQMFRQGIVLIDDTPLDKPSMSLWKRLLSMITFSRLISLTVYIILFWFVVHLVDQVAMSHQRKLDAIEWEAKWGIPSDSHSDKRATNEC